MNCIPVLAPSAEADLAAKKQSRQAIHDDLLARVGQTPNRVWLAQIIASWAVGDGVLPDRMGLDPDDFKQLLAGKFAGYSLAEKAVSGSVLDYARMLEKQDLEVLLRQFAVEGEVAEREILISLIVSACLGSDHLWQDLGLWSRKDLSDMLRRNFPELVARNSKDMKWKKFLYKQLCEAEGLYVCRAPSCEVCHDYPQCFGPED